MDESIGSYDDYAIDENDIEDFEEYVQYYHIEDEDDSTENEIQELYF